MYWNESPKKGVPFILPNEGERPPTREEKKEIIDSQAALLEYLGGIYGDKVSDPGFDAERYFGRFE